MGQILLRRVVCGGVTRGAECRENIWYLETLDTDRDPSKEVVVLLFYRAENNETHNAKLASYSGNPPNPTRRRFFVKSRNGAFGNWS